MNEDTQRHYSIDDVNRIIRRALQMETVESVTHEELLSMAQELGVNPGKLEAAIKMEAAAMERARIRKERLKRAQAAFKAKLWSGITANIILFIIDCLTPGGWWFQWPLLGTGISLAVSFRRTYFPTDEQIEAPKRSRRRKDRKKFARVED